MVISSRFHSGLIWTLSALLTLGSFAYVASKTVLLSGDTIDFGYIWLAGHMWLDGVSPYSSEYARLGKELFAEGNAPGIWVYPPHWWPIAGLASLPAHDHAQFFWQIASGIFLIAGCAVAGWAVHRYVAPLTPLRFTSMLAFACLSSTSATALALGQTSTLIMLAASIFVLAYLSRSEGWMTVALVLLMLKPQLGIVFSALLVPTPYWRRSLLIAVVSVIVLSSPTFAIGGFGQFVRDFLTGLSQYGQLESNLPHMMTSVRFVADQAFGVNFSSIVLAVIAAGVAAFLPWIFDKAEFAAQGERDAAMLTSLYGVALSIVPLHTYDLCFAAPLVALTARAPSAVQLAVGVVLLIVFRANNLESLLRVEEAVNEGVPLTTYALFALMVTSLPLALPKRNRSP
jgi:hypothetical protein